MKCPKCGYNSFESHDTCKKCAHDLTSYKEIHGLKSLVLPLETRTLMAEKLLADNPVEEHIEAVAPPVDMFSFHIPDHDVPVSAPPAPDEDPFNFDIDPVSAPGGGDEFSFETGQDPANEEDSFSDLIETTSLQAPAASTAPQPAAPAGQAASDLSSFSWDDSPPAAPGEAAKPAEDDFNSLFGESDDSAKK